MLFTVIAFLSACEYEFIELKKPDIDPDVPLSFKSDIVPIFQDDGCVACHSTTGIAFSLEEAQAYQSIQNNNLVDTANPQSSPLYVVPDPNSAEQHDKYSVDNAAKVLIWIQQGAKNN